MNDQQSLTTNPAGSPEVKITPEGMDPFAEFERFEDLATRLMRVSKSELNEKLKEE